MEAYKREFIEFLQSAGVLKFGDFTAKSGRKIPYFVNAGMIKTGRTQRPRYPPHTPHSGQNRFLFPPFLPQTGASALAHRWC